MITCKLHFTFRIAAHDDIDMIDTTDSFSGNGNNIL